MKPAAAEIKELFDPSELNPTALQDAEMRAERAEKELENLKHTVEALRSEQADRPARKAGDTADSAPQPVGAAGNENRPDADPLEALSQDTMMAHLLRSLDAGKDIGHYGRLVFAMVARHFLSAEAVIEWLTKDRDFSVEAATAMVHQVESRDYSPPRRERILAWQREQEFPILPDPDDPDCGNLYRNLKFPGQVYEHIQEYQEEKAATEG